MAGPARNAHGSTVRGLTLSRGSKFFGGQFGRMFRSLPPADFGVSDTESEKTCWRSERPWWPRLRN